MGQCHCGACQCDAGSTSGVLQCGAATTAVRHLSAADAEYLVKTMSVMLQNHALPACKRQAALSSCCTQQLYN